MKQQSKSAPAPQGSPGGSAASGIVWLSEGFGFDAASGEWYSANATAVAALKWRAAGLDRTAIVERMAATFEVDAAAAERDLESFFAGLPAAALPATASKRAA